MAYTNNERQRIFKEKMYKAGFMQIILWVKRKKSNRTIKMSQGEFIKNLNKITYGWEEKKLSQLYSLLLLITKGKKEAEKLKKRT